VHWNELTKTSVRENQWRALIKKIRQVYKGKLIYAANFHNEFDQIRFWDALDFIGIQAYFPLTSKTNPDVTELARGWNKHFSAIEKVVAKFQKPVVFTEIGYRSTNDAAIEPWVWPQNVSKDAEISESTQADCYEAFFKSVWNKQWMAGAYFWKWYPHGARRMAELDFTPQGKKASMILKANFRK
jgi:Glycosyl hydrolase family 53.